MDKAKKIEKARHSTEDQNGRFEAWLWRETNPFLNRITERNDTAR